MPLHKIGKNKPNKSLHKTCCYKKVPGRNSYSNDETVLKIGKKKWPQCKGYSASKILSLGQNIKLQSGMASLWFEKHKENKKVNERAQRYVYKVKTSAYHELQQRISLGATLENRRVQDMLNIIGSLRSTTRQ